MLAFLLPLSAGALPATAQKAKGRRPGARKTQPISEALKKTDVRPAPATAEEWRKRPPVPAPERPLSLPAAHEVKLDNGLTLILSEDHRVPLVTFNFGIAVGDVYDPPNLRGLAEATAALLTEGAGGRSSEQIDTEVETLGGQLSAASNDDYTGLYGVVVSENSTRLLELMGDVLLRPDFPESEVALYKSNRAQKLIVDRQDPAFLASEQFNKTIYGAHPYGVSAPTPESIAAIDRAKIENFYQTYYQPAGAVLVITGDFATAPTEARLRAIFNGWQPRLMPPPTLPAIPVMKKRHIYLIDRPSSEQADFTIGNLAVARSDADFFPLLVANAILGDGTGSRLFLNIREKKGYSYDVSSSVIAPRHRGVFFGSSQTRTAVAVAAIREMLLEFERLGHQPVSAADLQNAKNYLIGSFSLSLSTQGGVTERILQTRMLNLPADYLKEYRERINAVTIAQVQDMAQKYIRTNEVTIVVVGNAVKLRRALSTLGAVEVITTEGKQN